MALGHPLALSAPLRTTMVDPCAAPVFRSGLQVVCERGGMANTTLTEMQIDGRGRRAGTPVARGMRRTTSGTWSRATRGTRVENVTDGTETAGLRVDPALHDFVADELLPDR